MRLPSADPGTGERLLVAGAAAAVTGAAFGPFWQTFVVPQAAWLTLGRVVIVVSGLLLMVGIALARRRLTRPPLPLLALVGAMAVITATASISALTRGCLGCDGAWLGLVEFCVIAVLFAAATAAVPSAREPLLLAAAAGSTLAALTALSGLDSAHDSLAPAVVPIGRLAGTYGNPNFLALAVALGMPLLLCPLLRRSWALRVITAGVLAVCAFAILLTYSRAGVLTGGLATALAGALSLPSPRWRRRAMALGLPVLIVAAAAGASWFDGQRTEADFSVQRQTLSAIDLSGWDGRAQGPIPGGPSSFFNVAPDVLAVTSYAAGQGVSIPVGPVRAGANYTIAFEASADVRKQPFLFALQDNFGVSRGAMAGGTLTDRWRRFSIRWQAPVAVEQARLYIWQETGPVRFFVFEPQLMVPGQSPRTLETKLRGTVLTSNPKYFEDAERDSYRSRIETFRVGLRAFVRSPVFGIGWQRYPAFAAQRVELDALATHNEYLRFAAEMGLLGVVGVLLLAGALALGIRALGADPLRAPLLGGLAAGMIGLLFVNALETPTTSLPLAAVMGVLAGTRPWTRPNGAP